jgi:hypothetical protein
MRALALLALPIAAAAAATATRIRITDHAPSTTAVVSFGGGAVRARDVTATDAAPSDGRAALQVRDARAGAPAVSAHGLRIRIDRRAPGVVVRATAEARRFKYLAYRLLHGPTRLVITLWKSSPPSLDRRVQQGAHGCLTLDRLVAPAGRVTATGRENGLFEHRFTLALRDADGRVLARRGVTAAAGRWRARITYTESRRQPGTLEAVARSAKDGAVACLAQARVILATKEAAP